MPHIDLALEIKNNIFLAYQFADEDLVEGLIDNLTENNFTVIDGKMLDGSISAGILEKIRHSYYFIAVVTRRDELKGKDNKFTTSSWILEEKGAALMHGLKMIVLVEEGVDEHYIGSLQGDLQRIPFTIKNFSSKFKDILRQLKPYT